MKNFHNLTIFGLIALVLVFFSTSPAFSDGTVTVTKSDNGKKIKIIGDDLDNCIQIETYGDYLEVKGLICESPYSTDVTDGEIGMTGVTQIIVKMKDGDDVVRIEEIYSPGIDWNIKGNEGSDLIAIETWSDPGVNTALVARSLSVKGGSNDDIIIFRGVVYIEMSSEVNGGAGHDVLALLDEGVINPISDMGLDPPYFSISLDISRFETIFWGACFRGDTLVATETGLRPIRTIKVGDRVWSWDESSGNNVLRKVSRTMRKPAYGLRTLRVGQETIYTTDGHPYWVESKGWVKAHHLRAGDTLRSDDGTRLAVLSNDRVDSQSFYAGYDVTQDHKPLASTEQKGGLRPVSYRPSKPLMMDRVVYNLEVEDTHTFFVGKQKVLVHNK